VCVLAKWRLIPSKERDRRNGQTFRRTDHATVASVAIAGVTVLLSEGQIMRKRSEEINISVQSIDQSIIQAIVILM